MKPILLASQSPRRFELMKHLGLPFEVLTDNLYEEVELNLPPHELVLHNAVKKAEHVVGSLDKPCFVVSADTVVSLDGFVMGKPKNKLDAFQMLKKLSGRQHEVFTGLTVVNKTTETNVFKNIVKKTIVFMVPLTDSEIDLYIQSGEPMDKAGAYAIQGKGSVFVEKIDGDYYTVVGLPIAETYRILKEFGAYDSCCP